MGGLTRIEVVMGKMKETASKSKGNRSSLAKGESESDRLRKQEALRALADQDFDAVVEGTENEVQETGVVEKETLESEPFVIVGVDRRDGDFGAYVSVTCKTRNGIVVFNDGSTGVMRDLEGVEISPDKPETYMKVMGGLRASHYTYTDPKTGKEAPATTWYLAQHPRKAKLAAATGNSRAQARA